MEARVKLVCSRFCHGSMEMRWHHASVSRATWREPVRQRSKFKVAYQVFQAPDNSINDSHLNTGHFDKLIPERVVFRVRTIVSVTIVFLLGCSVSSSVEYSGAPCPHLRNTRVLRVLICGILYLMTFVKQKWVMNTASDSWKTICSEITAHCGLVIICTSNCFYLTFIFLLMERVTAAQDCEVEAHGLEMVTCGLCSWGRKLKEPHVAPCQSVIICQCGRLRSSCVV